MYAKRKGAHSMRVTINHQILDRLRSEDEEALIALEKQFQGNLTFVADQTYHINDFKITNTENDTVLFNTNDGKD